MKYQMIIAASAMALAACGGGENEADTSAGSGTGAAAANEDAGQEQATRAARETAERFVPKADQFGVKRFKIVYDLEGQTDGRRTMWVENYGERVGLEYDAATYGEADKSQMYWNGERMFLKRKAEDAPMRTIRVKDSEPTSFAVTKAADLERVGYERLGEKTVAGVTCEHWKNETLNYEGCRWNNIELEFLNGAGTDRIIQRVTAVAFVEGEGMPDRLKALAQ